MAGDWYYLEEGVQRGPVSEASLKAMLGASAIAPDTPVWTVGASDWLSAADAMTPAKTPPESQSIAAPQVVAARKRVNGWLVAWQVATLLLVAPTGLFLWFNGAGYFAARIWTFVSILGLVPSSVFVIAMFWRQKWALYGFLAVTALQLAFWSYATLSSLHGIAAAISVDPLALLTSPPVVFLASVALLFGALRLGGRDAGWSAFR